MLYVMKVKVFHKLFTRSFFKEFITPVSNYSFFKFVVNIKILDITRSFQISHKVEVHRTYQNYFYLPCQILFSYLTFVYVVQVDIRGKFLYLVLN